MGGEVERGAEPRRYSHHAQGAVFVVKCTSSVNIHLCQAYDEAVSLGEEGEAVARSNRSAAYLKTNKHREALQDASVSVKLQPKEVAFYRKG